jgi:hypothetical protein
MLVFGPAVWPTMTPGPRFLFFVLETFIYEILK